MADNNSILEKLDGLVARFEEVSTLITDPAVIADQKRYVKLTKEYKDLDDLMKARKEYMQLLANIEEAKDILSNESDTDMREMAKRGNGQQPGTPSGIGRGNQAVAGTGRSSGR